MSKVKMKSARPLLIDGVPQTEFETTEQHAKELVRAKLAERLDGADVTEEDLLGDGEKQAPAVENKMAPAARNKSK